MNAQPLVDVGLSTVDREVANVWKLLVQEQRRGALLTPIPNIQEVKVKEDGWIAILLDSEVIEWQHDEVIMFMRHVPMLFLERGAADSFSQFDWESSTHIIWFILPEYTVAAS